MSAPALLYGYVILISAVTVAYMFALGGFSLGLRRLRHNPRQTPDRWPSVSVIVPARNEADVLERTLNSLHDQDYPGEWEIIVVDDRSSDTTPYILAELERQWERLKVVTVIEKNPRSPKKNALALGIAASKGEIVVTTDADCIYHRDWLRGMTEHMTPGVGVVAGLTIFDLPENDVPRWQKIQWLDFFVQNFLAAGSMGLGHPASCNGSNLAFRREVYDKISGWGKHSKIISGDDVLFAQRVSLETDWRIVFAATPETLVRSLPVLTFRELLHQRLRWASKGLSYRGSMLFFLFGIYAYYLALLAAPVIAVMSQAALYISAIMIGKLIVDYSLVRQGCRIFKQERLLPYFLPYVLSQMIFVPFFGIAGLLMPYRWKGDWYRTARLPRGIRRGLVRVRRVVRGKRSTETISS